MRKLELPSKDYLYILPGVLFVGVFFISSILFTFRISFYTWDGFSEMTFNGIRNYTYLFQDPNFKTSLLNTLIWVAGSLVVSLAVPLFLAIAITNAKFQSSFKNIFYLPTALSGTVGGLIMATLLSSSGIPQIGNLFGRTDLVFDWLTIPYVNTFIMILMTLWQGIGLNLLLFIGALHSVDRSPVEAAIIDGASRIQVYGKVIFPLIKGTTMVVLLMTLVNAFKIFDNIWVMTKGGPYRTSETLALTMYIESFIYGKLGVGAAISVLLSSVVLLISYFYLKDTFREGL